MWLDGLGSAISLNLHTLKALRLTANASESSPITRSVLYEAQVPTRSFESALDLLLDERSGCLNPANYAISDVSVTHSIGVLASSDQSDGNDRRELYSDFHWRQQSGLPARPQRTLCLQHYSRGAGTLTLNCHTQLRLWRPTP